MTLKELRTKYGVSQMEMSDLFNITQGAYSNIESGKRSLKIAYAKLLGKKYGFDWWLLYED